MCGADPVLLRARAYKKIRKLIVNIIDNHDESISFNVHFILNSNSKILRNDGVRCDCALGSLERIVTSLRMLNFYTQTF